ncbi:substrate-binding periplasmic protein [Bdellovibrio bacteriovorus]|uniref:substrate-binding periplasmic protein n=1 Tax=Bdellovibrio bacteriovorus TaxID=959 RepID=UPI0035A67CD6
MYRRSSLALFIFCALFPFSVNAYNVVGFDYEPYYFKSGSEGIQGACYEILQKICQMEEASCKFKIVNLREALSRLKSGEADIGCPLGPSPQRESALFYSDKVFKTGYSFFGLPEKVRKIKSYDDLAGMSIGVISPSMTEVSLQRVHEFTDKKFKILPETSVTVTLRKAENKNYSAVYANRDVALAWIEKTKSALVEVPKLGEETYYSIVFSKKSVAMAQVRRINSHLEELRKNNFLQTVCEKYKLTLSTPVNAPAPARTPSKTLRP